MNPFLNPIIAPPIKILFGNKVANYNFLRSTHAPTRKSVNKLLPSLAPKLAKCSNSKYFSFQQSAHAQSFVKQRFINWSSSPFQNNHESQVQTNSLPLLYNKFPSLAEAHESINLQPHLQISTVAQTIPSIHTHLQSKLLPKILPLSSTRSKQTQQIKSQAIIHSRNLSFSLPNEENLPFAKTAVTIQTL